MNQDTPPPQDPRPVFPETNGERPPFEDIPLTRAEYITALAHFYRAEMHRALIWRTRLDTTTNWAIVGTLAILTASLQSPGYASEVLLMAMFTNLVLLFIEARRFRFFDVFRARVRMLEENFYVGILRRDQSSPEKHWGAQVADDLLCPRFHLTRFQAVRARLMRNFRFIFGFLLLAWIVQRTSPAQPDQAAGLNHLPGWALDGVVAALYLGLLAVVLLTPKAQPPELAYFPDPEHPGEDISSLDV